MSQDSQKHPFTVGLDYSTGDASCSSDAYLSLHKAREDGFDYVTTTIPTDSECARLDVTQLEAKWWRTSVVGVVLPPTKEDTQFSNIRASLDWSLHMNLPAVLLPPLPENPILYAAALTRSLAQLRDQQIWIPLTLHESHQFQLFHRLIDYHSSVSVALVVEPIPTGPDNQVFVADMLRRLHLLIGNVSIAAILLPADIFLTNKRNFPTLSKPHQTVLSSLLCRVGRTTKVLLKASATKELPGLTENQLGPSGHLPYLQYLRHLRENRTEITSALDSIEALMESSYLDALQKPLQPLADHLEFQTYEVFEQDPIKYKNYKAAILKTMIEFAQNARKAQSEASIDTATNDNYIMLVVGAGRGPLVTACIEAAQQLPGVPYHVYAVEKNPSAVLYLKSKKEHEWRNLPVTVVKSDLRKLDALALFGSASTKANLIVSELLGSFGCNELSPECLCGLFATDVCGHETVSVPTRYSSFAAPVSSMKLFQNVQQQALIPDLEISPNSTVGFTKAVETPYVVRSHAASQTHKELECWTFEHSPTSQEAVNGERYVHLIFDNNDPTYALDYESGYGKLKSPDPPISQFSPTAPLPWICTGLLGTFTADLTKAGDETISTAPNSFSVGMFSWFPLYFPVSPVLVPAGAIVHADIWRKCDTLKVWYEWGIQVVRSDEILFASPIHNAGGRSYQVLK